MKPLHAGLAAVTSCLAFGVLVGCSGGGTEEVSATRFDVVFRTPIHETGASAFCQGAQSLVLALDSAGGQSGSWDRVFVLGVADRNLYGCGRDQDGRLKRCESSEIQTKLDSPERVLAEWLDVPATTYAIERGNVVCRGMYDDALGMGERSTIDQGGVRTLTLTLLLLRVGDTNYLHDLGGATSPRGAWMAASPLVHPSDLVAVFGQRRDSEGGHVVVAGGEITPGQISTEIHVFEPDDIAFRLEGNLPFPSAGLTATSISSSPTSSYVLFAGGWGNDGLAQITANTFDYLEDASVVSTSFFLSFPRAHHAAIRFDDFFPPLSGGPRDAIGLFGGCDKDLASTSSRQAEFFYLGEPQPANGCTPAGPGYLCNAANVTTDGIPRCHMAAGPLRSNDPALRGWMAGGFESTLGVSPSPSRYEARPDGSFTQDAVGTTPYLDRAGAATVPFGVDLLSVIGGVKADGTLGTSMLFISGSNVDVVYEAAGGGLRTGRGFHSATRLADRSILVMGGLTNGRMDLVEIGRITSNDFSPVIEFSYPVKVGGNTCTTGTEAGCVVLKEPRAAHTATRIDGTSTWLNGSVVIAGGTEQAEPEIYVPAYTCDAATGLLPVAIVAGSEQPLEMDVDFCDRGRAAIGPVTNPGAP